MFVIFDLDGTLADEEHRRHFIETEGQKPDWDSYHERCTDDPCFEGVAGIARLLYNTGQTVEIWTGRPESVRKRTEEWLDRHHIGFDRLRMRKVGDYRKVNVVKGEWLLSCGRVPDIVFEDRARPTAWWRDQGLLCAQTQDHDY